MTKRHKDTGISRNRKESNKRSSAAFKLTAARELADTRSSRRSKKITAARLQREAIAKATLKPEAARVSWWRKLLGG